MAGLAELSRRGGAYEGLFGSRELLEAGQLVPLEPLSIGCHGY
jgi:hypothetical protein